MQKAWIRQAITGAVVEQFHTIRLPHDLAKRLMQIKKALSLLPESLKVVLCTRPLESLHCTR
ncbi:hypothetical protein LC609_37055 [Nostoc sp. XA013]|nr:hypothetical protein [Nostoc sp. XA013]